jgi:hypothetical protein
MALPWHKYEYRYVVLVGEVPKFCQLDQGAKEDHHHHPITIHSTSPESHLLGLGIDVYRLDAPQRCQSGQGVSHVRYRSNRSTPNRGVRKQRKVNLGTPASPHHSELAGEAMTKTGGIQTSDTNHGTPASPHSLEDRLLKRWPRHSLASQL